MDTFSPRALLTSSRLQLVFSFRSRALAAEHGVAQMFDVHFLEVLSGQQFAIFPIIDDYSQVMEAPRS